MFTHTQTLSGFTIDVLDGSIGAAADWLIHDVDLAVRYLVVDTNKWLPGRKVLVPRERLRSIDLSSKHISVDLDADSLRQAPDLAEHPPRSKRRQIMYLDHYWATFPWGGFLGIPSRKAEFIDDSELDDEAKHLRSLNELVGYEARGLDKPVGRLVDVVLSPQGWRVEAWVVELARAEAEHPVCVQGDLAREISAIERSITIDAYSAKIDAAPELSAVADGCARGPVE